MIGDVILDPLLWESLEAGDGARIDCWLASEGERVRTGQAIARVRLLHQSLDLAAPHGGILQTIFVPAGERFVPGAVLAQLVPL